MQHSSKASEVKLSLILEKSELKIKQTRNQSLVKEESSVNLSKQLVERQQSLEHLRAARKFALQNYQSQAQLQLSQITQHREEDRSRKRLKQRQEGMSPSPVQGQGSYTKPFLSDKPFPTTAQKCLKDFKRHLSVFEREEVLEYETVYFLSQDPSKRKTEEGQGENHGFDNDKQEYNVEIGEHIAYRYEPLSILGKGSFGQVFRCIDHKSKNFVALKILRNKKRLYKQGLIETKILETLN